MYVAQDTGVAWDSGVVWDTGVAQDTGVAWDAGAVWDTSPSSQLCISLSLEHQVYPAFTVHLIMDIKFHVPSPHTHTHTWKEISNTHNTALCKAVGTQYSTYLLLLLCTS